MVDHTATFFADLCEIKSCITFLGDSWEFIFFLFFEGCCIIFYFALKGPVVCQKARYTNSMQPLSSFIPFKTSQHEKLPWTNQRGRLEKPHHQSKLHREATEHVFWMKSLPKAMMQSLDNSIQSKECLLDRKFFGGKDETLKQQN